LQYTNISAHHVDLYERILTKIFSDGLPIWSLSSVTTWVSDCLHTGKPSRYITNTNVSSAFHPYEVRESTRVLACLTGVKAGRVHLCRVAWQVTLCDPIWQVTLRSSEMRFL